MKVGIKNAVKDTGVGALGKQWAEKDIAALYPRNKCT
jgi:hypothetical protein